MFRILARFLVLALLTLSVVACAPTTDLRIPLLEPERKSGTLVILRTSDFSAAEEGEMDVLTATRDSFWTDLQAEMMETYGFEKVEVRDMPVAFVDTLSALIEKPMYGSSGRGWRKAMLEVPRGVETFAPEAAAVVIVRDPFLEEGIRPNRPVFGVGGIAIAIPLPSGRGVTIGASLMVFPGGSAEPIGVGTIAVYGRGNGFFENRMDERSADRAVAAFAERVADHGGFARR